MSYVKVTPTEHAPDCASLIRPINPWSGYRSIFGNVDSCGRCAALVARLDEVRAYREADVIA